MPHNSTTIIILVIISFLPSLVLVVPITNAQPVADTLVSWRGYSMEAVAEVELYAAPPEEEDRPRTVLIREIAENEGPVSVQDARHLAEIIGRSYGFDPTEAYFVFHWGNFSYPDASAQPNKELFLRATFNRTATGNLSTPRWRLIRRDAVIALTDRAYRF